MNQEELAEGQDTPERNVCAQVCLPARHPSVSHRLGRVMGQQEGHISFFTIIILLYQLGHVKSFRGEWF